ncbi:MAG: NAD-dependent protein deacylase [Oscillospiraceae bacterium]
MAEQLREMVEASGSIVFFGGAGVSTESGIPDFRGTGGLYSRQYAYPPETILSHNFFMSHTEDFYACYRQRLLFPRAKPNTAHLALAALEKAGKLKGIITQNIDGLHQAAGSQTVLELHGSVHRNTCLGCGRHYGLAYIQNTAGVPRCGCGGIIKPDVVLYGEPLQDETVRRAAALIRRADMLIIGGTSLSVYPAAGLVEYYRGSRLVLVNKAQTAADGRANLVYHASIGEVLGALLP